MSKTKLLLDLAGSLRNAADTLQEIVSCIESNDSAPATVQADSPAQSAFVSTASASPVSAGTPTLQPNERIDPETGEIIRLDLPALRAIAAAKAQTAEQKAKMRALLQKHGVSRLPELPLADYFAFQKEVEALE